MDKEFYQNVKTYKIIIKLTERNDLVKVQYWRSGMESWYEKEDFERLFIKIE